MGGRLFSDALFTSWFCGTASIPRRWTKYENIERVDASVLSVAEFASRFEEPGVPVILTGVASGWTASQTWSHDALLRRFGQTTFNVGALQMRLDHFLEYSANCHDETPLYLFDKRFAEAAPELAAAYKPPKYFDDDLFGLLEGRRPDWRWLIIGGARTGSAFHVDPNQTSAWNAVISGRKKWIMWPPHYHPPGVWPSEDGAETTSSASITEWFLNWYPQTQTEAVRPLECVCEAGELLFVPRGWWHCVFSHPFSAGLSVGHSQKRVPAVPEPALELALDDVPATVTVTGSSYNNGTLFFTARSGERVYRSSFTNKRLEYKGTFDMAKEVEKMCGEPDPPKAYTNLLDKFAPKQAQGGGASTSTEPPPEKRMRTRKDKNHE